MRHLNRILIAAAVLCYVCCCGTGQDIHIDLGFANIQTVTAAERPGGEEHMAPGIVVRIFDKSGKREAFGISNEAGIVVVPLRPGKYCLEAFNQAGMSLRPHAELLPCFSIRAGEVVTAGVGVVPR